MTIRAPKILNVTGGEGEAAAEGEPAEAASTTAGTTGTGTEAAQTAE